MRDSAVRLNAAGLCIDHVGDEEERAKRRFVRTYFVGCVTSSGVSARADTG